MKHSAAGPSRSTTALLTIPRAMPHRNSISSEGIIKTHSRGMTVRIDRGRCRQDRQADRTGQDARNDQADEIFGNTQRRRKKVEKISRPDIFEKCHGHTLHHANKKIPEEHSTEKAWHKIKVGCSYLVEYFVMNPRVSCRQQPTRTPETGVQNSRESGGPGAARWRRFG